MSQIIALDVYECVGNDGSNLRSIHRIRGEKLQDLYIVALLVYNRSIDRLYRNSYEM